MDINNDSVKMRNFARNCVSVGAIGDFLQELGVFETKLANINHGLKFEHGLSSGISELNGIVSEERTSLSKNEGESEEDFLQRVRHMADLASLRMSLRKIISCLNNADTFTKDGFTSDYIQNALHQASGFDNIKKEIFYAIKCLNAAQDYLYSELTEKEEEQEASPYLSNEPYVTHVCYNIPLHSGMCEKIKEHEDKIPFESRLYGRLNSIQGVECTDYSPELGEEVALVIEEPYDNRETMKKIIDTINTTLASYNIQTEQD